MRTAASAPEERICSSVHRVPRPVKGVRNDGSACDTLTVVLYRTRVPEARPGRRFGVPHTHRSAALEAVVPHNRLGDPVEGAFQSDERWPRARVSWSPLPKDHGEVYGHVLV
jgi:hypothetical protein